MRQAVFASLAAFSCFLGIAGCNSALLDPAQEQQWQKPLVYSNFSYYSNGTYVPGQMAETANSAFICGSQCSSAYIENGRLVNTSTANNFYISLPNTATNGGTPEPLKSLGETFVLCGAPSGNYDPAGLSTLLAATQLPGNLSYMIHLSTGPSSWGLWKWVNGVPAIVAHGNLPLENNDCQTVRQLSMNINATTGSLQVYLPSGQTITYPSAQYPDPDTGSKTTDPDITKIAPTSMTVQCNPVLGANSAEVQYLSVWMGEPPPTK